MTVSIRSARGLAAQAGGAAGLRGPTAGSQRIDPEGQMRGSSHARGPGRRAEIAVTIRAAPS